MKSLRQDLDNAHNDIRQLRDHEEQWEANRFQLESKIRDKEGENQRISLQMTNLDMEKKVI